MNRAVLSVLSVAALLTMGSIACGDDTPIACGDDTQSSSGVEDEGIFDVGEACGTTADCIGDLECTDGFCAVASVDDPPTNDPPVTEDPVVHENCGYDVEQKGTGVGDHIKNFSLKTVDDTEYNFHAENCGQPNRKALYVLLGTGWCGACENYAKRAESIYKAYKDAGLEILWVESEDQNYEPVTLEWLADWQDEKGTTFPLTRDLGFFYTYGAMAHASTALPHFYILDPTTMELIYAEGGGSKWDEAEGIVADLLGVDMPLYEQ